MPFSQERYEELQTAIRLALDSTKLNEWERNFLRDMQVKLDRYGPKTNFSDKQYCQLMKLTRGSQSAPVRGWQRQGQSVGARPRPSHRRGRQWRPTLGGAVVALVLVFFLIYKGAERFPEYFGLVVALTSTQEISGRVTHVRDGDTIEVSGVPIRFGSLDCAERDTTAGQRASAKMRMLVSGQRLTCHLNGRTSYDRKIGSCQLGDGRDLAGVMIQEGYCRRYW